NVVGMNSILWTVASGQGSQGLGFAIPAADISFLSRDPHVPLGRRVVAVGNPLGLGISASSGIVSAIDRNLRQSPYDSFIQTDAAINSGNSGGPLFDLDGNVVGMNSILWTVASGQGSQGLGFAIPAADISFL
ncbi:trypsin-like serine protease, partial [Mycobacterium tuberculosis]|nr:trypsin-like serine protease [Mycobacterium tuberculosis]